MLREPEPSRVPADSAGADGVCSDWPVPAAEVPLIVIVGPTAAGKSALSLDIAQQYDGEIVNADSMQLYQGMNIGTAKLSVDERLGVPHHLLDIWPLQHQAAVAEFQQRARAAIEQIRNRGKQPILVGGSGLYVNSVIDDLRFPATDPAVRARWESELAAHGPHRLHDVLREQDPGAAGKMEPGNGRRIVRALEVIEITGAPYSAQLPLTSPHMPAVILGMDVERQMLDERIEARVESMWRQGFVDEVRELAADGLEQAPTASRALGYAQVLSLLRGEIDDETARTTTKAATRRFARKQLSWYRRDVRVNWTPPADGQQVLAQLLRT